MTDKAIEAAFHAHGNAPRIVDVQTAYNAMRAAISAYEQALWRPIKEAPKDGTRFIAYQPHIGICVCKRNDPGGAARNPRNHYECWVIDGKECYPWKPTHYRPLPPPPETMAAGEIEAAIATLRLHAMCADETRTEEKA